MSAYHAISGTRTPAEAFPKGQSPCPRCGVVRNTEGGRKRKTATGLCRDCNGSLTVAEREAWKAVHNG